MLAVVSRVCVLCQLFEADWQLSAGSVLCQLHEAGWRLSAGSVYSVSYLRQYCGFVQKGGVLCHLHEAGWRLSAGVYSVSYMTQVAGCL